MGAIEIAGALAASRRAVRLYPAAHPTHRTAVRELVAEVRALVDIRPLTLSLREGRLYEGSVVIAEAGASVRALAEAMESRRVESLTFHMGFAEADAVALSEVLSIRPSPDLHVHMELEERSISAVTVSELEDLSAHQSEARDQRREADRSLYRQSVTALNAMATELVDRPVVDPVAATRVIAQFIERVTADPPSIIALAMMTGHGERWRSHSLSVMLYSLVIGSGIGMSDKQLLAVGLAGLMHDIGYTLDHGENDDAARSNHPLLGAHTLGALLDEDYTAMIVAYEHHMGVDGSGWPERDPGYVLHPCSRIVAVADRYDTLIRPPRGAVLRPDEAVRQLMREASDGPLDPVLTRVFVHTVGVMPVGTVLRLSDFSIGIVSAPGRDQLRPTIRLILASDGSEVRPIRDICLAEDERTILEVVSAAMLELRPSDYL